MILKFTLTILVLLLTFYLELSFAYICDDSFCSTNGCKTPKNCDGGRWIKRGGLCGCCDLCVTSFGENETCSTKAENGFPNRECGAGLACNLEKKICQPRNSRCVLDLQEYDRLKTTGSLMIGRLRPQCDYMGDYTGPQCITGAVCFCVDKDGERIFGTSHYTKVTSMYCGCTRAAMRLGSRLDDMRSLNSPHISTPILPGEIKSKPPFAHCMPDGSYDNLQCIDETCFCLNDDGELLQNLVNANIRSMMLCYNPSYHEESYYRTCELERQLALDEGRKILSGGSRRVGENPPRCDLDGTYAPVQCHGPTCYCVHRNGSRIENYQEERYEDTNKMNCYCARDKLFVEDPFLASQIKCLRNGNYAPVQCHGSLCFCVDHFGLQVGPEVSVTETAVLECESSNDSYKKIT